MISDKTSNKTRLRQLAIGMFVLVGVLVPPALPAVAQDGTGSVPENAHAWKYGDGWECDLGYRVNEGSCEEIVLPENAYATGRSYGTGWDCYRGFEEVDGTRCAAVFVPDNAFLRSSGYGWQCERGYQREADSCVAIVLPEHAYLTEDYTDSGWSCERGFVANTDQCVAVVVPENAFLTNARYGASWTCERGFIEVEGQCDSIVVPANAFLDENSYGPGWRCERGYAREESACLEIELPMHAHLDLAGNSWSCDTGFRLTDGICAIRP